MGVEFLQSRLAYLASLQNPDGGWGYFRGRSSWLEPTFYVMVAMHGRSEHRERWERGWKLVRSWQDPDGGVRPRGDVQMPNWTTALWVTLHCIDGQHDEKFYAAVDWVFQSRGAEGALWRRVVESAKQKNPGYDSNRFGWSWYPESNSWIEPTVHSLVALKKACFFKPGKNHPQHADLKKRINLAEQMILERRCQDGGWNYGSSQALGIPLPSYPECTGVALLGLQGYSPAILKQSLELAMERADATRSPLGKAWLDVALRVHGYIIADRPPTTDPRDILVAALEALACKDGNHALLKTPGFSRQEDAIWGITEN